MAAARVLLLHHREFERELLTYVLKHEGCSVTGQANVDDAAALLAGGDFALVLLDITLLREDGRCDTIHRLVAAAGGHIPLAVVGEPRDDNEITEMLARGASEWLGRSGLSIEAMLGRLRILLQFHQFENQGSTPDAIVAHPAMSAANLTRSSILTGLRGIGDLHPMGFTLTEVLTLSGRAQDAAPGMARAAGRDPILAAAVLAEANRHPPASGPIVALSDAVRGMGLAGVQQLLQDLEPVANDACGEFDMGQYWAHSLLTAHIAQDLARRLKIPPIGAAAAAGLLHDIGHLLMATRHPAALKKLHEEAANSPSIGAGWETAILGVDHAELGYCVLRHLGVPEVIQHVVRVHESPVECWQTLSASARLLATMVRAADVIADAIYPGEPILGTLANVPDQLESAAHHADLDVDALLADARRYLAELLTETAYQFPARDTGRTQPTGRKPFARLTYFAPNPRRIDPVRVYAETRAQTVAVLRRIRDGLSNDGSPMIINLSHLPDISTQVESLCSALAAGLMTNRRGIVFVADEVSEIHRSLIGPTWMALSLPTHPAHWAGWLEKPVCTATESPEVLVA
jgi:putative nucleotidyltransferase with HDIG domain